MDKLILQVTAPLSARTTGTITPPAGATLTWTPPPRQCFEVLFRPDQPPYPTFAGLVGDTNQDRLLLLDDSAQQLLQLDWGGEAVAIAGPAVAGAKLTRVAVTGAGRWLVADDAGRVWRSNGQGGWDQLATVTGGLRAMTAAGDVVHGVDSTGRYGTVVGASFQAGAVQPTGGITQDAAIAVDAQGGVWISDIAGNRLLHLATGASGWIDEGLATAAAVTAPGALCVAKDGTLWVFDRFANTLVSRTAGGVWSYVPPQVGGFAGRGRDVPLPAAGLFVDAAGIAWAAGDSLLRAVGATSAVTENAAVLWRSDGRYAVVPTQTRSTPWQGEVVAPFTLSSTADPKAQPAPVQLRFGFGMAPRPIAPPTCFPISLQTFAGMAIAFVPTGIADAAGPLSFAWSRPTYGTAVTLDSPAQPTTAGSATPPAGSVIWYTPSSAVPAEGATDTFTIQAVEGSLRSPVTTVQIKISPAPTIISATAPAGGGVVIPAPGPLGKASNQVLDTSTQSWRTLRWWGLQRPGELAYDATTNDLWVLTPRDFRQALWRRQPTGELTAYGRAAGIVDLQEVAGVACYRGTVWVADGARPLVWKRNATTGGWTSIKLGDGCVPSSIAVFRNRVYVTIPADGSVLIVGTGPRTVLAPAFSGPGAPKSPQAIAVDPANAAVVWVTNKDDARLYRWRWGWQSSGPGDTSIGGGTPLSGLAIDAQGTLWTTDQDGSRILTLTTAGDTLQWGVYLTDEATWNVRGATRIAVSKGGMWVSDPENDRILQNGCFLTTRCFVVDVRSDGTLIAENTNGRLGTVAPEVKAICGFPGLTNPYVTPPLLRVQLTSR